jgi:hypothetical protein
MSKDNSSIERARLNAHIHTERYHGNQLKQNQRIHQVSEKDGIDDTDHSIKFIVSRVLAIIISIALFIWFITWIF